MFAEVATRHRGPYSLLVIRPYATKPGFFRSEWLPGAVEADDVENEALALLTDPRDNIDRVHVWSDREDQFVFSFKREENEDA